MTDTVAADPELAKIAELRRQLWENGYRPVAVSNPGNPCKDAGKSPAARGWLNDALDNTPRAVWSAVQRGWLNTGILSNGYRALDLDISDAGVVADVIQIAMLLLGAAPMRFRSNSPKVLLVYRASEGEPAKRTLTGATHAPRTTGVSMQIEVLGAGNQFVAFGQHPSGAMLEWHDGSPLTVRREDLTPVTEAQIADFLALAAAIIGANPADATKVGSIGQKGAGWGTADAPPDFATLCALVAEMPNETDYDGFISFIGAFSGSLNALSKQGMLKDGEYEEGVDIGIEWLFSGIGDDTSIDKFAKMRESDDGRAGWHRMLTLAQEFGVSDDQVNAVLEAAASREFGDLGPEPPSEQEDQAAAGDPKWSDRLQRTEKGVPRANLLNAQIALTYADPLAGVFRKDAFANKVMLMARPPWEGADFKPRQYVDADASNAAVWLQSRGVQVGIEIAAQAILLTAERQRFDPLLDYLKGLTWDGVPRIDTWMADHLGAAGDDPDYIRQVSAKALIAAVARAVHPGCKVDTVPVLEGVQELGKSKAIQTLFGGEWFSDHLPSLDSKDAMLQLQGLWCIEIAELATLDRTDAARIKAFVSSSADTFRAPYGRVTETHKRRCVLWGTINPEQSGYLKDATGARRFWPVKCGAGWPTERQLDVSELSRVRDQLWAEAFARHRDGETWWLTDASSRVRQREVTDARYTSDPWEEATLAYLATVEDGVSMAHILERLGRPVASQTRADATRMGGILQRAGWEKRRHRLDGGQRVYDYARTERAAPLTPDVGLAGLTG